MTKGIYITPDKAVEERDFPDLKSLQSAVEGQDQDHLWGVLSSSVRVPMGAQQQGFRPLLEHRPG